jgi:hypothetical protein
LTQINEEKCSPSPSEELISSEEKDIVIAKKLDFTS